MRLASAGVELRNFPNIYIKLRQNLQFGQILATNQNLKIKIKKMDSATANWVEINSMPLQNIMHWPTFPSFVRWYTKDPRNKRQNVD